MNATARAPAANARILRAAVLWLLCATGVLVCQRALGQDMPVDDEPSAVLAPSTRHESSAPAVVHRAERLLVAVTRLGQRVMRLTPWHSKQGALAPTLEAAAETPQPLAAEAWAAHGLGWELKAAQEPLATFMQMARPKLRLAGGQEISLRVVGGLGVTLRSSF